MPRCARRARRPSVSRRSARSRSRRPPWMRSRRSTSAMTTTTAIGVRSRSSASPWKRSASRSIRRGWRDGRDGTLGPGWGDGAVHRQRQYAVRTLRRGERGCRQVHRARTGQRPGQYVHARAGAVGAARRTGSGQLGEHRRPDAYGARGRDRVRSAEDALFGPAVVPFGNIGGNGRYRMPLLPGEPGVVTGGDWVPHGVMRATRLASAIEDTKSLNEWEQRHMMRGLVLDVSLYEELGILVRDGMRAGVDWDDLPEKHPDIRDAMTGKPNDSKSADASIAGRAKHMAGGNVARQKGTNRHAVWDARAEHGQWIGSGGIKAQCDRRGAAHPQSGV